MVTVGSLAYQIVANTSNFTQGLTGSRKELKTLKDAFLSSQTPVEKYSQAISHLESLAVKFPSKADVINRSIAAMRKEMTGTSAASKAFSDVMGRLGLNIDPVSAAFNLFHSATQLAHAGLQAIEAVADKVGESLEKLDVTAKKAKLLGVDPTALVGLRRAAEDIAGVSAEGFDAAFKKFGTNLGQAALTGKGPAVAALKTLGLDAQKLSGMGLTDAILEVAGAMEKVENVDERLALSKGILGKGGDELAPMLAAGRDAIRALMTDQVALSQTEFINFDNIEAANDAMGRLSSLIQGVFDLLASELSPLIKETSDDMVSWFTDSEKGAGGLRGEMRLIASIVREIIDDIKTSGMSSDRPLLDFLGIFSLGEETDAQLKAIREFDAMGEQMREKQKEFNRAFPKTNANAPEIQKQEDAKALAQKAAKAKRLEDQKVKAAKAAAVKEKAEQHKILEGLAEGQRQEMEMRRKQEDDLIDAQQKAWDATRTPSEKIAQDLEDLQALHGRGGMSFDVFQRSLKNLRNQAQDISNLGDVRKEPIGAIRAGSIEALREQFKGKDITEKQLEEQKNTTKEVEAANKTLIEIKAALATQILKEAV